MNLAGEQLQSICYKFVQSRKTQALKYDTGLVTAFLACQKNLGTCLSLRIRKYAMLLYNQRLTQRNHEQYAQAAANRSDNRNLRQRRRACTPLGSPEEQGRHGEDSACRYRLTGRTDGLNHIVLKNRILFQDDTDDTHGNNCRRNRRGNSHTNSQSQVSVCAAEQNSQQNTENDRGRRKLRKRLLSRNVRLKIVITHNYSPFLLFPVCFSRQHRKGSDFAILAQQSSFSQSLLRIFLRFPPFPVRYSTFFFHLCNK